jgi:hypothetical protein
VALKELVSKHLLSSSRHFVPFAEENRKVLVRTAFLSWPALILKPICSSMAVSGGWIIFRSMRTVGLNTVNICYMLESHCLSLLVSCSACFEAGIEMFQLKRNFLPKSERRRKKNLKRSQGL